MKQITLITTAILCLSGLSACTASSDETAEAEVCAVMNDDGTCACKKLDEGGQCVEGGGAVIIRSND